MDKKKPSQEMGRHGYPARYVNVYPGNIYGALWDNRRSADVLSDMANYRLVIHPKFKIDPWADLRNLFDSVQC